MPVDIAPTPQVSAYVGAAGTGKTRRLVEDAAALLAAGADPSELLVLCASPQGAQELERRLAAAGLSAGIAVTTPREHALRILGTPEAKALTGRSARMLLPFEEAFLFEDIRTTGIKERRSKEMLRFFARCWTELLDFDEGWLMRGEESVIHGHLKSCLAFSGGVLEAEVSNLAVRCLLSAPQLQGDFGAKHVIVDDYSSLSRASQVLANLLAGGSISVAADPYVVERVFESYPYAAGVNELLGANPQARLELLQTCWRPPAVAAAVNGILADGGMAPAVGAEELAAAAHAEGTALACGRPAGGRALQEPVRLSSTLAHEEPRVVASYVARQIGEGVEPHSIVVACASKRWSRFVEQALGEQGVPVSRLAGTQLFSGDIRKRGGCENARCVSLLALAAGCDCALAWRSLCGFGDTLAESYAVRLMHSYAEREGLSLPQALELFAWASEQAQQGDGAQLAALAAALELPARELQEGVRHCVGVYRAAGNLAARLRTLKGVELLEALYAAVCGEDTARLHSALDPLLGPVGETDGPGELYRRLLDALTAPRFTGPQGPDGVRLIGLGDASGLDPRVLVVAGFVNGFTPPRRYFDKEDVVEKEKQHIWARDLHLLYTLVSKPGEQLVLSSFSRMEPLEAQQLNIKVDRIRMEAGKRVCVINPSEYLGTLTGREAGGQGGPR